jgi:uncharacterized protein YcaQ
MAAPPTSTKTSLQQRLSARAQWPQLAGVDVRLRGDLAGAPEDALDTACGLYLGDPTAWA